MWTITGTFAYSAPELFLHECYKFYFIFYNLVKA